jgi:hypothetical protein
MLSLIAVIANCFSSVEYSKRSHRPKKTVRKVHSSTPRKRCRMSRLPLSYVINCSTCVLKSNGIKRASLLLLPVVASAWIPASIREPKYVAPFDRPEWAKLCMVSHASFGMSVCIFVSVNWVLLLCKLSLPTDRLDPHPSQRSQRAQTRRRDSSQCRTSRCQRLSLDAQCLSILSGPCSGPCSRSKLSGPRQSTRS